MMNDIVNLYAIPHSLYSARARSYFIKAGIDFREISPTGPHVYGKIKPRVGGRITIPIAEFADGSVIRDSTAIIDHFENQSGCLFSPSSPKQNIISRLFDVIGSEGLLRPAMHYRWSFRTEQMEFLKYHFRMHAREDMDADQSIEKSMHIMGNIAGPSFGISKETYEVIEAVYNDQLDALNNHFQTYAYLLGHKPSIGDFGMIGPLYAHLARDPIPASMMLERALAVYRWVERMNRKDGNLCEFHYVDEDWVPGDIIPETLKNVLKAVSEDFVPETLAAADFINNWIDEQHELPPGTPCLRGVGKASFVLRGQEIKALAQPYRFYLLSRFQAAYDALEDHAKIEMDEILSDCGMLPLLTARLSREIGRENNLEIWV